MQQRRRRAAHLRDQAERDPSSIASEAPYLVGLLNVDREDTRRDAAAALRALATTDFDAIDAAFDRVVDRSEYGERLERRALDTISRGIEYDIIGWETEQFLPYLDAPDYRVRVSAARAIDGIADQNIDDVGAQSQAIRAALHGSQCDVRINLLGALRQLAWDDADLVVPEIDWLAQQLDNPAPEVRTRAAGTLGGIASTYPERVRSTVPALRTLLHREDHDTMRDPLLALAGIATECPDAVEGAVVDVAAHLDHDTDDCRAYAAIICREVSRAHPGAVAPAVDPLGGVIDDEPRTRTAALWALTKFGYSHPDAVRHLTDDAVAVLDADDSSTRRLAADFLASVGRVYPDDVRPAVADLVARLDDGPAVVEQALEALSTVAGAHPDALVDHVERIAATLDHDDTAVQARSAETLAALAEQRPAVVRPVDDQIAALRGATNDRLAEAIPRALAALDPSTESEADEETADAAEPSSGDETADAVELSSGDETADAAEPSAGDGTPQDTGASDDGITTGEEDPVVEPIISGTDQTAVTAAADATDETAVTEESDDESVDATDDSGEDDPEPSRTLSSAAQRALDRYAED
ncbi:HEAT repeat domain-containing protein [Halococcoides cellulosivorans]|uniref:HEAT repeat domain-containing protein n=1 Tax=Halococcoides cellulosivorans TaxID=1679096 RepID=A0A2R4X243_9EURY|nr:HEAT repeat domain-containing protein [Halococcoides cellulosivorans]AWB27867.1 hypothetical protein HARCEL1_09150 [Halococcoides cellulosivorans]